MELIEKLTIQSFHEHRVNNFGEHTAEGLGWKDLNSQQKRFEILSQVGDLNNSAVLDLGCGYGDLKPFLDTHFSNFTYVGVDQIAKFVKKASDKYGQLEKTHFIEADFSKLFYADIDYILASGAFAYQCGRKEYYLEAIIHMFDNAKKGIAFNMLDDQIFPKHEFIKSHNKKVIVEFCKTLSKKVEVKTNYLEDDFTVFVWK